MRIPSELSSDGHGVSVAYWDAGDPFHVLVAVEFDSQRPDSDSRLLDTEIAAVKAPART